METYLSVLLLIFSFHLGYGLRHNLCTGKKTGAISEHPDDCSKFVVCIADGIQRIQVCPAGLHYSPQNHLCDHPYIVRCNKEPHLPITLIEKPTQLFPHEEYKPSYEEPRKSHMIHSVHAEIPSTYDKPTLSHQKSYRPDYVHQRNDNIDHPDKYIEVEPGIPACEFDGLFPDPSDCAWYIQCAAGISHKKPCPRGTYFSHRTGRCGYNKDLCRGDYGPAHEEDEVREKPFIKASKPNEIHLEHKPRRPRINRRKPAKVPAEHLMSGDELMSAVKQYVHGSAMQDAQESVAEMMKQEAKMSDRYSERRNAYSGVTSFLGSTPYAKQLSIPATIQLQALRNIKKKKVPTATLR